MHTVYVQTSQTYAVHIGAGLLPICGSLIAADRACGRCALVTDETVAPLYAKTVSDSLAAAGFTVYLYILPAGEQHKTLAAVGELLSFFAQSGLTRTDFAVSLGGGVVGDMTGFACAVYQRGIDFVPIPTTLLAACDASVGGKTAVDLPEGKNLAGAFHQPRLVLCDTDTFQTLPPAVFAEGMAEVIKHALIADGALLNRLLTGEKIPMDELVRRNVEIKAAVVAADEREQGGRKLLNFGHTLGHAVERCSGYTIPHGAAVAMGMALACRAAEKLGYSPAGITDMVRELLGRFSLPTDCAFSSEELFSAALADKKRAGDSMDVVVLKAPGRAEVLRLPLSEFRKFVEEAI